MGFEGRWLLDTWITTIGSFGEFVERIERFGEDCMQNYPFSFRCNWSSFQICIYNMVRIFGQRLGSCAYYPGFFFFFIALSEDRGVGDGVFQVRFLGTGQGGNEPLLAHGHMWRVTCTYASTGLVRVWASWRKPTCLPCSLLHSSVQNWCFLVEWMNE